MRVVRAGAGLRVEARHGLEVVVHHVRRRGREDRERPVEAAAEIGREDLDPRAGREGAHGADAVDEMLRAAVAQVVAVHARDHHVGELHRGDGLAEVARLVGVQRLRPAVGHVAERAAARAQVAHDHERGGAVPEALADVGAGGLLADGVELRVAQDPLDLVEALPAAGAHADPLGLAQGLGRDHLDRDARGLPGALRVELGVGSARVGHGGGQGAKSDAARRDCQRCCTASIVSRTPRSASRVAASPG